ncbi:MAG: type II toxin-antitoxin system Phd/YefM family antitoxin [Sandaracinus sp.]
MRSIKIAALKDDLSRTLRSVERGATITVTDRDRPVALLVPVIDEDGVEVRAADRPFAEVRRRRFAPTRRPMDSLAALRAERGTR